LLFGIITPVVIFSGCINLSQKEENKIPLATESESSPLLREMVIVSEEFSLGNAYLWTTTTVEDNGLFILSKSDSSLWYKVDTINNLLVPVTESYFIDENTKPDLVKILACDEQDLTLFPSPSNNTFLVQVARSYESIYKESPTPGIADGLSVPKLKLHSDIYLYDSQNVKISELGEFEGDISKIIWSPNENYLVINRNTIDTHDLYSPQGNWVVNTISGSISKIPLEIRNGNVDDPRLISSDGTRVIFHGSSGFLLFGTETNTFTNLDLIDEGNYAFNLWWYFDEERFLFLTQCDGDNNYSIGGFNLVSMERIETAKACINLKPYPFFTVTTDMGRYFVYHNSDNAAIFGRAISVINKGD
jgi:hypothetical protein